jgi:hypothetical protein
VYMERDTLRARTSFACTEYLYIYMQNLQVLQYFNFFARMTETHETPFFILALKSLSPLAPRSRKNVAKMRLVVSSKSP